MERLSSKEKAPFIRTLSIWEERHVLSKNYVQKLRQLWDSIPSDPQLANQTTSSVDKAERLTETISRPIGPLLRGDPKCFDAVIVKERLIHQATCNSKLVKALKSCLPQESDVLFDVKCQNIQYPDGDPLKALQAGLIAELNVCLFV